ncbi:MAG: acyl-CoA/acyl-ACP dehydrogenase [Deltaproteobacteria bacterium]|nr:acyl-CoA/acyl-ACP dehydrogenase [Deltaproteobacteria bacterium]
MGYLDLDTKMDRKLERLQQQAREFGLQVVRPAGIALDKLHDPADVIAEGSLLWDVFRQFREAGLHKTMIPKAYGGTMGSVSPLAAPLVNEQMGYADGGLAVSLLVSVMPFAFAILSPHREIRRWAADYAHDTSGKLIGCWAITEPDHGTDWVMGTCSEGCHPSMAPGLTAVKKGDEYIVNGAKSAWVSNGTIATHAVLHVGLDPSKGIHGSGLALCPLDLPGITRGAPLNKIGQRALNQGEIFFTDVKLPKKYMLLPSPGFFGKNVFGHTFLGVANSSMGVTFASQAQATLDLALDYAGNTRRNGKLLADKKDVRLRLFRMFAKVEAARLLARKVSAHFFSLSSSPVSPITASKASFWAISKALQAYFAVYEKSGTVRNWSRKYTEGPEEPTPLMEWGKYGVVSKITATETALHVAEEAMKLFGEDALSPDCPIEKMLRDARASTVEDGVNDALAIATSESL